ncbi:DUF3224 domain-containing protein [Silvimonas iriomotensis]|uniref:DUF3224 domain-containing protein n=1 Tax=Silvimonas iriomotensis TaxID=449662 RepID=A0ABQ2P5C8_9NEIS|nr:DUF3224 domain-containing protein [Silvimonas iriomotensis]GGP18232.1 hypothetical protein GCM10010970_03840 [Silvimonas iriomotensis]
MPQVTGKFNVRITRLEPAEPHEEAALGRMGLDKHFEGPLTATSQGQMLSAATSTVGSAGYVAMEKVTGTLEGLSGSFILLHTGVMNRGTPSLTVTVVPDSGSGELTGLIGRMGIRIENGQHFYDFSYTLADQDQ